MAPPTPGLEKLNAGIAKSGRPDYRSLRDQPLDTRLVRSTREFLGQRETILRGRLVLTRLVRPTRFTGGSHHNGDKPKKRPYHVSQKFRKLKNILKTIKLWKLSSSSDIEEDI